MAVFACDICGGNLSMDASGDFALCESCRMKHTKERVKAKMQEIGGSSVKPTQTITSNVSKAIPKRFTDNFIHGEIKKLMSLISECESQMESSRRAINIINNREAQLRNDIMKEEREIANRDRQYGSWTRSPNERHMINHYNEQLNHLPMEKNKEQHNIKDNEIKKYENEIKKYELEVSLRKTEVQRMEEHYQLLTNQKHTANDADELDKLAKEFREMEGYTDTEELACECKNLAVEVKYNQLVQEKNNASSEKEYQGLTEQFKAMNGYKNTADLASECDNRYSELKKHREEQERIERERRAEQEKKEKAERERREEQERIKKEQEKKEREEREHREAEEHERLKIKEKKKRRVGRISIGCLLGGLVLWLFCCVPLLENVVSGEGGIGEMIGIFFGPFTLAMISIAIIVRITEKNGEDVYSSIYVSSGIVYSITSAIMTNLIGIGSYGPIGYCLLYLFVAFCIFCFCLPISNS